MSETGYNLPQELFEEITVAAKNAETLYEDASTIMAEHEQDNKEQENILEKRKEVDPRLKGQESFIYKKLGESFLIGGQLEIEKVFFDIRRENIMGKFASKLPYIGNVVIVLKKPFEEITESSTFKKILKGLAVFTAIVFVGKLIYNNLNPSQQEFVDNITNGVRKKIINPLLKRIRKVEKAFEFIFDGVGTQLTGSEGALSDKEIEALDLNHENPIIRAHNIVLFIAHKIHNTASIAEDKITEIITKSVEHYFTRHKEIETPERFKNLKDEITTSRKDMLNFMAENDERVKMWKLDVFRNFVDRVDIDGFNEVMEKLNDRGRPELEIRILDNGQRVLVMGENNVISGDPKQARDQINDMIDGISELYGKDVENILSRLNLAIEENGEVNQKKKIETITRILKESYDKGRIYDSYEYKHLSNELKAQISEAEFKELIKAVKNSGGFLHLDELIAIGDIMRAGEKMNKNAADVQNEIQRKSNKNTGGFTAKDIISYAATQQKEGRNFDIFYTIEGIKSNMELFQNSGNDNGVQTLFSNLITYAALNNLIVNGVNMGKNAAMTQNTYMQANEKTFVENTAKGINAGDFDTIYVFDDNVALVNTIVVELDGGSRGRICASIKECLTQLGDSITSIVEHSIEEMQVAIEYIDFHLSSFQEKMVNPIMKRIISIYQQEEEKRAKQKSNDKQPAETKENATKETTAATSENPKKPQATQPSQQEEVKPQQKPTVAEEISKPQRQETKTAEENNKPQAQKSNTVQEEEHKQPQHKPTVEEAEIKQAQPPKTVEEEEQRKKQRQSNPVVEESDKKSQQQEQLKQIQSFLRQNEAVEHPKALPQTSPLNATEQTSIAQATQTAVGTKMTMQAFNNSNEKVLEEFIQQQMQQIIEFRKIRAFQVPEHIINICANNTAKEMSALSETPLSQNMI